MWVGWRGCSVNVDRCGCTMVADRECSVTLNEWRGKVFHIFGGVVGGERLAKMPQRNILPLNNSEHKRRIGMVAATLSPVFQTFPGARSSQKYTLPIYMI